MSRLIGQKPCNLDAQDCAVGTCRLPGDQSYIACDHQLSLCTKANYPYWASVLAASAVRQLAAASTFLQVEIWKTSGGGLPLNSTPIKLRCITLLYVHLGVSARQEAVHLKACEP